MGQRLIDADALKYDIGEIDDGQYKRPELYVTNEAIAQQPTVDAEPHWIPCSERLPEDGRYLCDYGDCIDFGRVINGEWYVNGVIAWMPLPKPYEVKE